MCRGDGRAVVGPVFQATHCSVPWLVWCRCRGPCAISISCLYGDAWVRAKEGLRHTEVSIDSREHSSGAGGEGELTRGWQGIEGSCTSGCSPDDFLQAQAWLFTSAGFDGRSRCGGGLGEGRVGRRQSQARVLVRGHAPTRSSQRRRVWQLESARTWSVSTFMMRDMRTHATVQRTEIEVNSLREQHGCAICAGVECWEREWVLAKLSFALEDTRAQGVIRRRSASLCTGRLSSMRLRLCSGGVQASEQQRDKWTVHGSRDTSASSD